MTKVGIKFDFICENYVKFAVSSVKCLKILWNDNTSHVKHAYCYWFPIISIKCGKIITLKTLLFFEIVIFALNLLYIVIYNNVRHIENRCSKCPKFLINSLILSRQSIIYQYCYSFNFRLLHFNLWATLKLYKYNFVEKKAKNHDAK